MYVNCRIGVGDTDAGLSNLQNKQENTERHKNKASYLYNKKFAKCVNIAMLYAYICL